MVKGNVSCVGDEDCLSMCKIDEHTGPCQKFAAVACNGKSVNTASDLNRHCTQM